jgi:hypothetical protein
MSLADEIRARVQPIRPEQPDVDPIVYKAPPLDWAALWADQGEDSWLLEPLIPEGGQTVIYSAPKVGKSLLMLELAAGLACGGRHVLGHYCGVPVRVLYLDFENRPRADIRKRLRDMGYAPEQLGNLITLSFPPIAKLDTPLGGLQLLALAQHYRADLVVLDTVSRCIQGEENSNDTWIQFYANTGILLKNAKIALVRLDHTGKDEERGQRGGSAKSGDVDMVWHLKTVVQDEVFTLQCTDTRVENAERLLTIKRCHDPLRHEVDAMGVYGALEAKQAAMLALLDKYDAPKDIGVVEAHEWLRSRGHQVRNNTFTKRMLEARKLGLG